MNFVVANKNIRVKFVKGEKRKAVASGKTFYPSVINPYREGGVVIPFDALTESDNEIVFLTK